MYHPTVFRIGLCRNTSNCIFGKLCSHAHFESQLRNRGDAADDYCKESFQPILPTKTLASSIDISSLSKPDYDVLARKAWRENHHTTTEDSREILEHQRFAISRSSDLLYSMQEAAFEECLATVKLAYGNKINIRAIDVSLDVVWARVSSLLDEPSPFFVSREISYPERSISTLRKLNKAEISSSKNLLIQFLSDGKLRMTAVRASGESANAAAVLLDGAAEKIEFWISREGYRDLHSCGCCCEELNADQGIMCRNGHFYCSVGEDESAQCFASLVTSQILQLSSRKDHCLLCPECDTPYKKKDIASNLPNSVFDQFEQAIVDAKVTKKADELNGRFNERLQAAVAEVLATYGNAEAHLLLQAKNLALEARNTVLNLRCPHCKIAYFDFSGCMAIQCKACEGNFCAYCHQKTGTSAGAHEHVRQCLMNETAEGSYYATPEQIQDAQK